jgi:alpha,alpha-trehalase
MTGTLDRPAIQPARSTALSPFPPIADYAFLSDCHTGALIAPDGSVEWLCVPRFDSPSVFGSVLDREAGIFRLGPYGTNHPTARAYLPGTNVLETTWRTQSGWVVVRDALAVGVREDDDEVIPHTRPPTGEACGSGIERPSHHVPTRRRGADRRSAGRPLHLLAGISQ